MRSVHARDILQLSWICGPLRSDSRVCPCDSVNGQPTDKLPESMDQIGLEEWVQFRAITSIKRDAFGLIWQSNEGPCNRVHDCLDCPPRMRVSVQLNMIKQLSMMNEVRAYESLCSKIWQVMENDLLSTNSRACDLRRWVKYLSINSQ